MANKSRLSTSTATFDGMMKNGFGVVTVMNVKIYDSTNIDFNQTADAICNSLKDPLCTLETLKISNITMEGPSKTITGGQYNNTLIKFGKTARLEMQDALGTAEALDAICGTVSEYTQGEDGEKTYKMLHSGSDFSGIKTIVGESFFIDKDSGEQVRVKVIFYQFNPDSIFNLTQEADGDATVFDLNGDLLMTNIQVALADGTTDLHGVFYTILPYTTE